MLPQYSTSQMCKLVFMHHYGLLKQMSDCLAATDHSIAANFVSLPLCAVQKAYIYMS